MDGNEPWRQSLGETRQGYELAVRAQALDKIQELIEPYYEDDQLPPPDVWRQIVIAAFPPPPMAQGS